MKTKILKEETGSRNYVCVEVFEGDEIDAQEAAQEYLNSKEDSYKYEYITRCAEEIENNIYKVPYNVKDK